MPVKLAIAGRSPISVSDDHISIGSDPCCSIVFPDVLDVKPIHAVIKEISGRWLVEACDTELLTVGNSEPGRRHWLKPGDVIRLTTNGHVITFQPPEDDDDFLPLVPKFAESAAPTTNASSEVSLEDGIRLTDTVDLAAATTSVSLPATDAPLSGTLPTTDVPLSGTIQSSDSGTIATTKESRAASQAKRPASGTIKSVKDVSEPRKNSSQSDGEIPARRRKKSGGSGPIPASKSTDDEIDFDLPVLTRSSSWEEEEIEPVPRRRRSNDKAEMEWIMNVVGRCAAGGVAFLIVWIAVGSLWKSLSEPGSGLPNPSSPASDANAVATNTVVTPASIQAPQRPVVNPAVPSHAASKPEAHTASAENQSSTSNESAIDDSKSAEVGSPEMNVGDGDDGLPEQSSDMKTAETQNPARITGDSPSDQEPLSPVLQATIESLYAVVMQDPDGVKQIHVGTAWAISDRHLVTSGTIATRVKVLQKQGYTATAVQPSADWALRISDVRIHAKYLTATAEIVTAVKSQNEKLLAQALVLQLRHNLAVLDLDLAHHLEQRLPIVAKGLRTTTETVYSMVGFPMARQGVKEKVLADIGNLQECRSKRLSPTGRTTEQIINVKFATQVIERDWSGSPVLNKDKEVIGIYAEIPATDKLLGKKDRQEQAVVWIGLLRDFAADVLKKTADVDEAI